MFEAMMNSQDFDYLSREIESIRRELGAGIPVPEKKAAEAASSDLLTFASLKDHPGASETGWSTRYLDGETGLVLTYFLTRTIGIIPASINDFIPYQRDLEYANQPYYAKCFCYDKTNTGDSLDLRYFNAPNLFDAITMTKVSSSRIGSTAINRVAKIIECNQSTGWPFSNLNPSATISRQVTEYAIISVVSGSGGSFVISGDHASEFTNGDGFYVTGSTGNDKTYTVSSSSYASGPNQTTIIVSGSIASSTSDGSVGIGGDVLSAGNVNLWNLIFTQPANFSSIATPGQFALYSSKLGSWIATKSSFVYARAANYYVNQYYHDETGTVITDCPSPAVNPISVADNFIPRGKVCIEQISPMSSTMLVRLRHETTGELYEGSLQTTLTGYGQIYNEKIGMNVGSGGRAIDCILPTPGQSDPLIGSRFKSSDSYTVLT
jgi:hypothetical protein